MVTHSSWPTSVKVAPDPDSKYGQRYRLRLWYIGDSRHESIRPIHARKLYAFAAIACYVNGSQLIHSYCVTASFADVMGPGKNSIHVVLGYECVAGMERWRVDNAFNITRNVKATMIIDCNSIGLIGAHRPILSYPDQITIRIVFGHIWIMKSPGI